MDTLFIGKNIIFLPEIHSTNSYAIDLLKNVNLPEGTVVHTANQTNGKGQRGNSWKADPGRNLTASFILKPGFLAVKKQFYLYQIAALACYDAMAELINNSQIDIKIKWPNDILVNKQKIAGILIENNLLNNQVSWSVIGIGLNVNQEVFSDAMQATSLKRVTGIGYEIEQVLKTLSKYLEKHYLALINSKFSIIQRNYMDKLFGLQQHLSFEINGQVKVLFVEGVSGTGLLVLKEESGHLLEVDVKEVKWLY